MIKHLTHRWSSEKKKDISNVYKACRVGKATRAHQCAVMHPVGTLRFAHPTNHSMTGL
jgi:hypothetical protein